MIIVESPTKAKTLGRFLGQGYQIDASMGHVRDLPESKLGIDVDQGFKPDYVIPEGKVAKVAELKKEAAKAGKVILATDPDREGEAIAYHLSQVLKDHTKFERITFHEITENAIKEALSHPGEIKMDLVNAQQARRILDRLVGYKLSPLLWRKVRRGLSAGRVQSVAVRLIVEREREINAFKPDEYWELAAKFEGFEAQLKQKVESKDQIDKIVESLKGAEFKVENIVKKEVKRWPYPPFTTSTLQQAASNLFGWGAKKTMQIAQRLYEEGLITYHRTDSTNLNIDAAKSARDYIEREIGKNYVPVEIKFYKTKSKVAQEAHEAIRPTNVQSAIGNGQLDKDQKKLYELIWKRFVASQMNEAVYEQTSIDVIAECHPELDSRSLANASISPTSGEIPGQARNDTYVFRANGNKQNFDGWQRINGQSAIDNEQLQILPELTVGEVLKLLELLPSQHFTEPPPRYTEATLIKILEEYGIGRPSTYAPIISTILERNYVEKIEKKLSPTVLGNAVTDFLMANFSNILDYQFTAGMENNLDAVARGEKKWVPVIEEFYKPFEETVETVGENAKRVKIETETTDEKCPLDGAPLVIRIGRFGRFMACSNFPTCKFTKAFHKNLGIKCPKCGGDVVMRKTKKKKTFYGCNNYPKCDFASWTKPK